MRQADGPPKMPIATVPPRSAVSSPTLLGGVLDGAEAAGGVLGEGAAGLGGHDAAPGADEEVGAERLLELADLFRDRGLRDAQGRGGGGEGAELDRRAEAADLLQRQKLSFGYHQEGKATLMARGRGSWPA